MMDFIGLKKVIDEDFIVLLVRLTLDLAFASVVIRAVYFKLYRNREYVFTYFLFNIITFALCLLLRKVPIELGFALGLFAVFGILRYRTEPIRIRDLTYLFIVIGLGILNALANKKVSLVELLAVNSAIVGATVLLELRGRGASLVSTPLLYDRLELLAPERKEELVEDIKGRTGLAVERVELTRIDLLRDSAQLQVFHSEGRK